MSNTFVHIELNTKDVAAAKKFYKKIFDGWSMHDDEMGPGMTYTMLSEGKKGLGGMQSNMPNLGTTWLPYVEVDDVKKTLAKAEKAGAKVLVPYMPIGEMGGIAVFSDPTGAALGIWAAAPEPTKAEKKAAKKAAKAAKEAEKAARKAEKKKKK